MEASVELTNTMPSLWRRVLPVAAAGAIGALSLVGQFGPAHAADFKVAEPEPVRGPVIPVEDADGFLWLCREDDEGKQSICIPWPQPDENVVPKLGFAAR